MTGWTKVCNGSYEKKCGNYLFEIERMDNGTYTLARSEKNGFGAVIGKNFKTAKAAKEYVCNNYYC